MALHRTDRFGDIYASPLSGAPLPKYRMPSGASDPRVAYQLVHDELALDGNAAQNLATFCTTWADDQIHRLMAESLGKNMVDKDEYPQTAEIESRCVHILADLWNAPDSRSTIGCSTTGSSEAAMLAGLALKWRWRQSRGANGDGRPNLVCGPVQVCWEKFARYFDVELRQVPLEDGAGGLRPHQLRDHVDANTIGVVAILGTTFTCEYEPVAALSRELDAIGRDTGLDIPIHVDAASGGFVAPFLRPELEWDFRLPRVVSVNASGHKYGLAPLGVGWVVWRSDHHLPEELVFRVSYLGGDMPTFALNFSRPGGEVIAQYYNFVRLGREGYHEIQQRCRDTAVRLGERIAGLGPFSLLYDGRDGLPAICYELTGADAGFTLFDLADRLRMRGWQVPAYPLPPARESTVVQRILIRRGISADTADLLFADLTSCLRELTSGPGDDAARAGFHH
ncbi:glutamate decarboxylase [Nocardiopsis sediminis]|uniref:Glutamate decarboxylase n=1 Tax=Nocardiopsis sediminis TaxID=1778267 RepID=A0ABV8FRD1_9ACTN